ncbi:hypothetical protein EV05_0836 [Prochlorococcus sp. MIT 0601]|nr:hypothetical protein EV05_0836 [Prochlorococcus sp. MIT 0601]
MDGIVKRMHPINRISKDSENKFYGQKQVTAMHLCKIQRIAEL